MHNKTGPPSVQNLLHWKPAPNFSFSSFLLMPICDAIFPRKWCLWRLSMAVIVLAMVFSLPNKWSACKFCQCPSGMHQMGSWTIHCSRKSMDESLRLSKQWWMSSFKKMTETMTCKRVRGWIFSYLHDNFSEWMNSPTKYKIQIQNGSKYRLRESLRVNELAHLDLLMRRAPAFSPASPQSIFHVQ